MVLSSVFNTVCGKIAFLRQISSRLHLTMGQIVKNKDGTVSRWCNQTLTGRLFGFLACGFLSYQRLEYHQG